MADYLDNAINHSMKGTKQSASLIRQLRSYKKALQQISYRSAVQRMISDVDSLITEGNKTRVKYGQDEGKEYANKVLMMVEKHKKTLLYIGDDMQINRLKSNTDKTPFEIKRIIMHLNQVSNKAIASKKYREAHDEAYQTKSSIKSKEVKKQIKQEKQKRKENDKNMTHNNAVDYFKSMI